MHLIKENKVKWRAIRRNLETNTPYYSHFKLLLGQAAARYPYWKIIWGKGGERDRGTGRGHFARMFSCPTMFICTISLLNKTGFMLTDISVWFCFLVVWNKRLIAQRRRPCKQRFRASPTECEPEELWGGAEELLWRAFSRTCEEPLFIGLRHRAMRR